MEQSKLSTQKFFKSKRFNCSYIKDNEEQRLFVRLDEKKDNSLIFNKLMENGFRRNLDHMYIPICSNCSSCISSRIRVNDFKLRKNQIRNVKKNKGFSLIKSTEKVIEDRFSIFRKYTNFRHSDGQMKHMNQFEFENFFYKSPVKSIIYDLKDNKKLIGSIILDVLKDGLSAVYSFYDPDYIKFGLGNYIILSSIEETRRINLKYLYLGYWIKESKKMNYKTNFNNLELFKNGKWIKEDL